MKIVTIGGGTGTFTVLSGLKKYPVDLTAIVTMADSGGSTGRLRDEFGYLPVGDVRMALAALAEEDDTGTNILRELFLYRFDRGEKGLKGHNFGNLFLVAMEDILGSQEEAIEFAARVLRLRGRVLPVTSQDTNLVAHYEDGTIIKGESFIDEPPAKHDAKLRITDLSLDPPAHVTPEVEDAISQADLILLSPGDLYTSLIANLIVTGVPEAINSSNGLVVYIVNLMSKYGQTLGLTASGHVAEVAKYLGQKPDVVLINDAKIPPSILRRYEQVHESPIIDDLQQDGVRIVRADILAREAIRKPSGDVVRRSLVRHDGDKVADEIIKLLRKLF